MISLPSELWIEIFALAVHVPGLLDTHWHYSHDKTMWDGTWGLIEMDDESRKTRQAIPQVSRSWLEFGRQFLYEDVQINYRNQRAAENLVGLLEQSGRFQNIDDGDASSPTVGYGRWVKRLTITGNWFGEDFPIVVRLLQGCTNIRILHLDEGDWNPSIFPQLSQLLQSRFAHCLRTIMFRMVDHETEEPVQSYLFDLLNFHLDSGAFAFHSLLAGHNINTTSHPVAFSTLVTLEILIPRIEDLPHVPAWNVPNLRYLSLDGLTDHSIPPLLPFIAANGPKLSALRLLTSTFTYRLYDILKHTTTLSNLILDDVDLHLLRVEEGQIFPKLNYMGLVNVSYGRESDCDRVTAGLSTLFSRSILPNLRVIRILNTAVSEGLERGWERPIALAAQYGVRLEDCKGDLLWYEQPEGVGQNE